MPNNAPNKDVFSNSISYFPIMTNPIISIIVPVYNVEKYLPKCVDSILGQTYTNRRERTPA